MDIAPLDLACPLDQSPLTRADSVARCANGHSFDRAREGYLNLLTSQHKASRDPGDTREMLDARHRVLARDTYAPLARRLFPLVEETHGGAGSLDILDAGCGEGYYLDRFAEAARASPAAGLRRLAGTDISKWGIRRAARRSADISWAVANNRYPPLPQASVDLIMCMFGFPIWDAFRDINTPAGSVLLVDPAPDHLIELRSLIYPQVNRREPPSLEAAVSRGYRLVHQEIVGFPISLRTSAEIIDLLGMTPHLFRVSADARARLNAVPSLDMTAHVALRLVSLGQ